MKRLTSSVMATMAAILLCSAFASGQETQREKYRSTQPTVTGGTGLFTVYDASTLRRGEFNVSYFYNNFDRDPGDVDIGQNILNASVGVTCRLELFASSIFRQQVSVERPGELSGFLLPNVRFPGFVANPRVAGAGTSAGAPFIIYPGSNTVGALTGGVLPGLPQTGFRVPGYLNDYPFIGRNQRKVGNTTVGAKFRFTSQDSPVGVALIGFVEIPSFSARSVFEREGGGIISGSGSGSPDYGLILAVSPRIGLATISFNVGAVKTGDPNQFGIKYLDRRNKLIGSVGLDIPLNEHFQIISELTSNVYYGSGTPNLNPVNPLDVTIGARFVPFGKNHKMFFSFGGAYRRLLNPDDRRDVQRANADYNGFVANLTLGYRNKNCITPPDPCLGNVPPTVTVSGDKIAIKEKTNEVVTLTAVGKDPDPRDSTLSYSWSATSGSINGSGSAVSWVSTGTAPGAVTFTVTVTDSCSHTASASTTVTVEKVNNCPTVSVSASPDSIREGSDTPFTFTARGNDVDGDPLTYTWSASRGTIQGSGATVTVSSRGLSPGPITVSVTVNDGQCSSSPDSATVRIIAVPPPPPVYSTSCSTETCPKYPPFKTNVSRTDNQCKAILDGVADRLRSDPTAVCLIDGHSDKGEKAGTAKDRADKARAYLIEKGIDGNRIEVRSLDDTRPEGGGNNRRVVIHVIPAGAKRPE